LMYQQLRLLYNRYIRTFEDEIFEYLDQKGFEFVESVHPNHKDWSKSPFTKPYSFFGLSINHARWTAKKYMIIIGQKKNMKQAFWMELKTTYFKKPIITFRESNLNALDLEEHIIKVGEYCPACGSKLSTTDNLCPDCGLNFE